MPTTIFSAYALQAMNMITTAHTNGNLLYSHEYKAKHPDCKNDSVKGLLIDHGLTTHTHLFEQYRSNNGKEHKIMVFRLKPKVSASAALRILLTSGETVIDCGTATMLAHIFACLLALEQKYGEEAGRTRFDYLFGAAGYVTPSIQRLLFSNNTVLGGTKDYIHDVNNNISPLNPFTFLFDFSEAAHTISLKETPQLIQEYIIKKCGIGSIITMAGNEAYDIKHPCGNHAHYNGIYVGTNASGLPMLSVFGLSTIAYTEKELKQFHINSYNEERTDDDKIFVALQKSRSVILGKYPEKLTVKDVPGFSVLANIDIIKERFDIFMNQPAYVLMEKFRQFLSEQLQARGHLLPEDTEGLPKTQIFNYHFPKYMAHNNINLLFSTGAKVIKDSTSNMIDFALESNVLDKELRQKLGVTRKPIEAIVTHSEAFRLLPKLFPEATIEAHAGKHTVVIESKLYPKFEDFVTNFNKIEEQITKIQTRFRAKKLARISLS